MFREETGAIEKFIEPKPLIQYSRKGTKASLICWMVFLGKHQNLCLFIELTVVKLLQLAHHHKNVIIQH